CVPVVINFSPTMSNNQFAYHWNFGDLNSTTDSSTITNPTYTFSNAGTYTVTLIVKSDSSACSASVSDTSQLVITIHPFPNVNLGPDLIFCDTFSVSLDAGNLGANYVWSTNATTQSILVNASGIYSVNVGNAFGCLSSDSIAIEQIDGGAIFPPNVFTPNNDGINDLYNPTSGSLDFFNIKIYDRWGIQVFASDDAMQKWDGNFGGKPCTDGVYYWIIFYENCEGEKQKEHGFVQLIR
ncbi:MAG: gliding motility-associated C-terminal domain-containing protein, partial [Bacteroidia bacterium]